jgi:hypothetical protein
MKPLKAYLHTTTIIINAKSCVKLAYEDEGIRFLQNTGTYLPNYIPGDLNLNTYC